MSIHSARVTRAGRVALPAEILSRWGLEAGGSVEVVDLGESLVVAPAATCGFRSLLATAVDESGGHGALIAKVVATEPELGSA